MIRQQLAQQGKQRRAVRRHEIHENVAVIRGARVTEHQQKAQTLDLNRGVGGAALDAEQFKERGKECGKEGLDLVHVANEPQQLPRVCAIN